MNTRLATLGDNRNTGKLATAPKPNPVNLLRVYDIQAGGVINVDSGEYILFDPIAISGTTDRGLGLEEGFTLRGPSADPLLEVLIQRANPCVPWTPWSNWMMRIS